MRQTKSLQPPWCSPRAADLCRLSRVPAGRWPFPTLSLRSLHRCLDPYPVASLRCYFPFLPKEHRPHLTSERFGTLKNTPCIATSPEDLLSRLQSFSNVQAPMFAWPSGCSHPIEHKLSGQPGLIHHAEVIPLPKHNQWHRYVSEPGN